MSSPSICVIVGSLRAASLNRRLGRALARLAGSRAEISFVDIGTLPLYNQDQEDAADSAVQAFRQSVVSADAVLFITPEYNRSIPGVLKNAIDIGSRPYGKSVWAGKPAAVCGASPGATGTAMAQQHLRNILAHLDMQVLGQPEVFLKADDALFADDGSIRNEGTAQFLGRFVDRFLEHVAHSCK